MELEKELINEQGDYETITENPTEDKNECKKCGFSLAKGTEIFDSKGNKYCGDCAKKALRYYCQHCQKVFRLSNYSDGDYD